MVGILTCLYVLFSVFSIVLHQSQHKNNPIQVLDSKYTKTFSHKVNSETNDCLICHYNAFNHFDLRENVAFSLAKTDDSYHIYPNYHAFALKESFQEFYSRGPPQYFIL